MNGKHKNPKQTYSYLPKNSAVITQKFMFINANEPNSTLKIITKVICIHKPAKNYRLNGKLSCSYCHHIK